MVGDRERASLTGGRTYPAVCLPGAPAAAGATCDHVAGAEGASLCAVARARTGGSPTTGSRKPKRRVLSTDDLEHTYL
jgi:hypothetical protein